MAIGKRLLTLSLGVAMAAAGIAGCGSPAATGKTVTIVKNGVAFLSNNENPDNLNPALAGMAVSFDVIGQVFDGLINYLPAKWPKGNTNFHWVPTLATAVPTTANGLITNGGKDITFNLRQGVKFADGEPFNATAVIDTWKAETNSYNQSNMLSTWTAANVTSVTSANPYQVTFHFAQPYGPAISALSFSILPPSQTKPYINATASNNMTKDSKYNNAPYGTGPFMVKQYLPNQYAVLVPNPNYPKKGGWDGEYPIVRQVVYKFVPSTNSQFLQMRQDNVQLSDMLALDTTQQQEWTKAGLKLKTTPGVEWQQFTINLSDPIMSSLSVRKAVWLAMNRQKISQVVSNGAMTVSNADIPPQSWGANPNIPVVTQNLKEANSLLSAAGWKMGANGFRYKNGQELTITCITTSGNSLRQQIEEIVQQEMKQAGINWQVKYMAANAMFAPTGPINTGHFQVTQFAWLLGLTDPDNSYFWGGPTPTSGNWPTTGTWSRSVINKYLALKPKGGNPPIPNKYAVSNWPEAPYNGGNLSYYNNEQVDKLLNTELHHLSQSTRQQALWQVESILHQAIPVIPGWWMPQTLAETNTIHGVLPNPTGYASWTENYMWSQKGVPTHG